MWREVELRASRLWVRHAPKRWPTAKRPYLDLAERRIVWPAASPAAPAVLPAAPLTASDIMLLPPVENARSGEKAGLLQSLEIAGGSALDQRFADDLEGGAPDGMVAADLLFPLLQGDLAVIDAMPPTAIALVALLPGGGSPKEHWAPLLARLARRTPHAVVGIAPELSPLDRRRLVEALGEERFEEVHHGRSAGAELERDFARAVAAAGMSPFVERPELALPPRAARNRALAAALFEIGERWLALGRSEAEGAAILAAARHVEGSDRDLAALARERQLALLPFLSPLARSVVEEVAEDGRSGLLASLRGEWLGSEVAA